MVLGRRYTMVLLLLLVVFPLGLHGQTPSIYELTPLNINDNAFSEISPVIYDNGILFCSNRRLSGFRDRTSFDGKRLYNIWFAEKIDSSEWGRPKEVVSDRRNLFNNGPLCVDPEGRVVYFTSEVETGKITKRRKYENHSGIFMAEIEDGRLVSIKPFRYNSDQYDIAHPSVSADGRYLYFSSNMPGGEGGADIWSCEFIDNEWSEPVNLGSRINSRASENYPFIHESGKLYFSSGRSGGFGGMDIYYASANPDGWNDPVLLAEPINSSADDFAFNSENDGSMGYFSSNRERSDNIYQFESTIIRKISCDELEYNYYCYEFFEENAVKYDTIPFEYEWEFGDGEKAKGDLVDHCYAGPGTYVIKLNLENLLTGEVLYNQKTYYLEIENIVQPYIFAPDTATVGERVIMSAEDTNLPGWDIDRYYWNFDDESIAVGENVEKSWSGSGIYDMQLIVTSKPDGNGVISEACVGKRIVIE